LKKIGTLSLLAALALALVAAGCGSSDDSSTGSGGEALTKAEFIKQGNAICKKGNDELEAKVTGAFKSQPTEAQIAKFSTEEATPIIEDEVSQLKDLSPPSGDEDTVSALFDAIDSGIAKVKEDPASIAKGNDAGGNFAEANKLANDYGLTVCGS